MVEFIKLKWQKCTMLNWDAHHMTGTRYLSTLGLSLVCYLASFPHLLLQLFRAAKVK